MTHKPAIIFDFGGVLIDWNPRHLYRSFFPGDEAGMERFLDEIDFQSWNLELDRGSYSFAHGVGSLTARFPQYAGLIDAYNSRWEESLGGLIQPVVEMLPRLKASGYPLHGLTNFSAEKFEQVARNYKFIELFDSILVSGRVGLIKPDPRIFALLLKNIQRQPGECIFIDDSPANARAARDLGFDAIQFQSPARLGAEFSTRGITF